MGNALCIKCGLEATHHHKYCDKHYPNKSAKILQQDNLIKTLRNKIKELNVIIYNIEKNICTECEKKDLIIKSKNNIITSMKKEVSEFNKFKYNLKSKK